MITQKELEALLETLATHQPVSMGVGEPGRRGWFRAQVVSHDVASGRLVLTCFMDRPGSQRVNDATRSACRSSFEQAERAAGPRAPGTTWTQR